MPKILIGIDGTGPNGKWGPFTIPMESVLGNPFDCSVYDQAMKNSFVNQITRGMGGNARYYRGPASLTLNTITSTWGGLLQILKSGSTEIYLTGYSRGAAAVTELAHYLKDQTLTVEAMFLFDPVKRELSLPNAGTVPSNVKNCYTLLRSLSGAKGITDSLLKWDSKLSDADPYQRRWMGSTSNIFESPKTHRETAVVAGSHGALGGSPWYEYAPDEQATETAARWMTAFLQRHGLGVSLRSDWVSQNKVNHPGTKLDRLVRNYVQNKIGR